MASRIKRFHGDIPPTSKHRFGSPAYLDALEEQALAKFDDWRTSDPNIVILGIQWDRSNGITNRSLDLAEGGWYFVLTVLYDTHKGA